MRRNIFSLFMRVAIPAALLAFGSASLLAQSTVGDIKVCYYCVNNFGISPTADGPAFIFENSSGMAITNGVFTLGPTGGSDSFKVGTIPAGSNYILLPGINDDGGTGHTFFAVTGSVLNTSNVGPNADNTQFRFTGQWGSATIDSGVFTPATSKTKSNDGAIASMNFLGGPGDNDGPCNNCYGPTIIATLSVQGSGPIIYTGGIVNGGSFSGAPVVGDIKVCYFCINNFGIDPGDDGPAFIFENPTGSPITNGVFTLGPVGGSDSFKVPTIPAGSNYILLPGISNDGGTGHTFFAVTGSILDTSDSGPDGDATQFRFTGQWNGLNIDSSIFTPATSKTAANDGTIASINFLGGPDDGPCNNCYGPTVVTTLSTSANLPAPGSIGSLFGSGLATSTVVDATLPLSMSLGGASLQINGVNAPLFFVSSGQINFQIPWQFPGSTPATITVTVNQVSSGNITGTISPVSPAIFTINSQGTGQGAIQIANTAIFAAPAGSITGAQTQPVSRGQFITIYCTGLGAVTNTPASGGAASGSLLSATTLTPTVMIGGQAASVSFSGLSPGFVGLDQVNVQVPSTAPTGNAVPLVLSIGGETSNTVTMAVQ